MTAATAIALNHLDRVPLQRHPVHNSLNNLTQRPQGHKATPSLHQQDATEENPMSRGDSRKTLGERISSALWQRINTGRLSRKHLKHALTCSDGTIDNLLSGNHDPSGRILMALISYLDESFANEILAPTGCVVAKLCNRRAEALKQIAEGMKALKALDGA